MLRWRNVKKALYNLFVWRHGADDRQSHWSHRRVVCRYVLPPHRTSVYRTLRRVAAQSNQGPRPQEPMMPAWP